MLIGSRDMSFHEAATRVPDALRYAFQEDFAAQYTPDEFTAIIANLRIPRTVLALLAGGSLGAAGAIIQGHTRNTLADPGLLGVNAGAAVAVVSSVYFGWSASTSNVTIPAVVGAAIAAALVFILSSRGEGASNPLTLILAGTAISALLHAFVNALVLSDDDSLDAMRQWATGSVAGRPLEVAYTVIPAILIGLLLAALHAGALTMLGMGETTAASLGVNVRRTRMIGLLATALLGGAAVAAAGPVAFVGLAAPHVARMLWGVDYRKVIPGAILIGAGVALWADILGRIIVQGELAMGIVLGIVGVPLFIALVKKGKVVAP